MLRTSDLDYHLPEGRIATHPASPRDAARLMVVDRRTDAVEHLFIRDLPEVLGRGDLLVANATRVLPARFRGIRIDTGGRVEGLYLREGPHPGTWVAMIRARRFLAGAPVRLHTPSGGESGFILRLVERMDGDGSEWVVEIGHDGPQTGGAASVEPDGPPATPEVLGVVGLPPIPPYILSARRASPQPAESADAADREDYQTVFAAGLAVSGDGRESGSVAAPTAGLHFTPGVLAGMAMRGVERAEVVLHVGPGTFKPVETEFVEDHPMHAEWCSMPVAVRGVVRAARQRGGRIVAVGTTSARTLESFGADGGAAASAASEWLHTRLLITPGYAWRWTDALLTNFHLPRSTLMALVAAMLPGGVERLKGLYRSAIAEGYRFYSYGDAMLLLDRG